MVLLTTGTLFLLLIKAALFLCQFAIIFGGMAILILGLYGCSFFSSYFRRIVASSANGEPAMPDWPDVSDFQGDVVVPFLQLAGTVIMCMLPYVTCAFLVPDTFAYADQARIAATLFGYGYFPMAFLALSMLDSVVATNPAVVVPAILKVPLEYLLTAFFFGLVMILISVGNDQLPRYLPRPIAAIPSAFLSLYLLTVLSRVLGLLYHENKRQLGWFRH